MVIEFDPRTKAKVQQLVLTEKQVKEQLNLICQTVLNIQGVDGNYKLADDLSGLVRVE